MTARTAKPCAIVELRQYTHHRNRRDDLIELFEREFIEGQEAVGMTVIGQFRDLEDPDRFIWLRGFPDMAARAAALAAFYDGPLWKANRDAANATLIDNDNVLLLRPAHVRSGFALEAAGGGLIAALVYAVAPLGATAFDETFRRTLEPALVNAGSTVLATFVTEHSENTFPRLPVREGEDVFVCFVRFVDRTALERFRARRHENEPMQTLLLGATLRSRIR
jgi:hypothetical protein